MTILVIDDLRNFRVAPEGEIVIIRTLKEAMVYLKSNEDAHFEQVWLDHDLGGDDKITPVVDYFCERALYDNPVDADVIYIQSSNPVGVHQMVQGLNRYGYRAYNVDQTDTNKIFYNSEKV